MRSEYDGMSELDCLRSIARSLNGLHGSLEAMAEAFRVRDNGSRYVDVTVDGDINTYSDH